MRVIVVGAGIMGLASAWSLTKRGHEVTLLEKADAIPSPLAASGDWHRMIRRAYGARSGYARLVTEAFEAWDELWADLGASHYVAAGILSICQYAGDEADLFRQGFDEAGTPYERLDAGAAAERYPYLDPARIAYAFTTPEGGALMCRDIARDLAAWLAAHGAAIRTGADVTQIDETDGRVTLAGGETLHADRIVVAAGAWTPGLVPQVAPRLAIYRTLLAYLTPPADLAKAWKEAPAILSIGGPSEGYALPPVRGAGLKIGASIMKRRASDPEADRLGSPEEARPLLEAFAVPFARFSHYRVSDVVTCAYTFTEDERFTSIAFGKVLAVSACSGHAYKFGAAIGRRVAQALEAGDDSRFEQWLRAELAA